MAATAAATVSVFISKVHILAIVCSQNHQHVQIFLLQKARDASVCPCAARTAIAKITRAEHSKGEKRCSRRGCTSSNNNINFPEIFWPSAIGMSSVCASQTKYYKQFFFPLNRARRGKYIIMKWKKKKEKEQNEDSKEFSRSISLAPAASSDMQKNIYVYMEECLRA